MVVQDQLVFTVPVPIPLLNKALRSTTTMTPQNSTYIALVVVCLLGLSLDSLRAQTVTAKPHFGVAVLYDGESERMAARQQKYIDELLTLVSGEFDISIEVFRGDTNIFTNDCRYRVTSRCLTHWQLWHSEFELPERLCRL